MTLNADGANNDIIFQSNGTTKATLDQAGLLTATSFAGSGANLTSVPIADNAITLAKMASGTDGNIISYDASGNPVAIATGSDGQVLTSTGAGSPPAFETLAVDVELTPYFMSHAAGGQVPSSGTWTKMTFSQLQDSDNAYDDNNNKFIVPSGKGGRYFLAAAGSFYANASNRLTDSGIKIYKNGSTTDGAESPAGGQYSANPGANALAMSIQTILTLAAGDYIEVYGLSVTNSGAVSFGARTFSGFKIGA